MIRLFALFLFALPALAQTANPERLFQEAIAAQERGDDSVALQKYRELLRARPGAVMVRANMGATLAHMGRFDEAVEQYRAVLATDPKNQQVRMNLALAYYGKGDVKRAVAELEPLHRSAPDDPQTAMLLGDCYLQLGRYKDAVSILAPLEPSHKDDLDLAWLLGSALIRSGKLQEGLERIDSVVAERGAEAYLLAGQTRLALSQYDLAKSDGDNALRLNPSLAGVQTLEGMVLEHTGDYPGAVAALREALKVDANDFNAHFYLGAILYFRREMAEARLHLERALALEPNSAQARYELALLSRAEGRTDEALRHLENVVRADPNWLQPHVELAALYYQLHRPADGAREKQIVDRLIASQSDRPPVVLP